MPIRKENRSRYPKDWPAISAAVRDEAGQRCECRGECGSAHGFRPEERCSTGNRCNAPNGANIWREPARPEVWHHEHICPESLGIYEDDGPPLKLVRVILTVAHLDHKPENCDRSNLRAMCQRCHNRYDAPTRAAGIRKRRREARACGELL